METNQKEITKNIKITNEEFSLIIKISESKLLMNINSDESIKQFERTFCFKELIDYRAFSVFDRIEEIFSAIKENLNSDSKLSLEYNAEKNLDVKFEFTLLSKKINVPITLVRKTQDVVSTLDYVLEEMMRIKRENKGLQKINEELRKQLKEFTSDQNSKIIFSIKSLFRRLFK